MSKSTNRYGKVLLHARASIEATITASDHIKGERQRLDEETYKLFGKQGIHRYDDLSDKQKSDLHYALNTKRKKGQEELVASAN